MMERIPGNDQSPGQPLTGSLSPTCLRGFLQVREPRNLLFKLV